MDTVHTKKQFRKCDIPVHLLHHFHLVKKQSWTLRNSIIWHKPNAMPESVTDRFSNKYEYIFMFTKQEKYYFDLDSIKEPCIDQERLKRRLVNPDTVRKMANSGDNKVSFLNPKTAEATRSRLLKYGKNPGDIWNIPTQPSSEKHYAMWPERLVERMVRCSTKAGDVVIDPFAGSATTLKVSEQLNRKGIGIDLGYHEMSKRRTGKIQKELFV